MRGCIFLPNNTLTQKNLGGDEKMTKEMIVERYRKMIERLTKVEEDLMHVQKRLEGMTLRKGG